MANPLLRQYMKLTEFLGYALGPDYEVALHDLTDQNKSIIAIANNHISGRQVGAPMTNVGLQSLKDKSYKTEDYRLHYRGVSVQGKMLRSSTMFIKDGTELIGMLCINFDDSRYRAIGKKIIDLCHPNDFLERFFPVDTTFEQDGFAVPESFHNSIDAVAADAITRELQQRGITANRLTAEERMEIIMALETSGIFLLKGAVNDVAEALHCSKASVYRYLSQAKGEDS
ncbi:MAG: PAS domain-containing protein [Oscillospiraceae bacterium]